MNKKIITIIAAFSMLLPMNVIASSKKWLIEVEAGEYNRTNCMVNVDLPKIKVSKRKSVTLYEVTNGDESRVECQLTSANRLSWIVEGELPKNSKRSYNLKLKSKDGSKDKMEVEDNSDAIILKCNDNPILAYNYTMADLPEGVGKEFSRSGYIHPIYSPKGNILTNIQPVDHRHHYGLWNPWTKIEYGDKIYDLWNLVKKEGTVRAKEIEEIDKGDVIAGYRAKLDHVIFTPNSEKVVMEEIVDMSTCSIDGGYLCDFTSTLETKTSTPLTLKEYRYGGFGFRATADWTKDNCEMFTSEGYSREEIDGTRARWIYVTGECKNGRSGILFLGHPDNYNSPQPVRIWAKKSNRGRGDAFINFAPAKNMDWKLQPKETLRYRLFVYDGEMTPERAERYWIDYAKPPVVTIHK